MSVRCGVKKYIYAASCSVYGYTQNKLFDESSVYITNSIFINQQSMGIGIYTELPDITADYLLFWNNEDDCFDYELGTTTLILSHEDVQDGSCEEIHFTIIVDPDI